MAQLSECSRTSVMAQLSEAQPGHAQRRALWGGASGSYTPSRAHYSAKPRAALT